MLSPHLYSFFTPEGILMNQTQTEINENLSIFNSLSLDFIKDPYHYYRQIPHDEPLLRFSPGYWITKDYSTIQNVLMNKKFQRNFWKNKDNQYGTQIRSEHCLATMSHWMLLSNSPDHNRLRSLVAPFFSRIKMEMLRSQIEKKANELIDNVIERGGMDVINDFSLPLAMEFVYQILGVPKEDKFELLSKIIPPRRLLDPPAPLTREELDLENFRMQQLEEYVKKICLLRQVNPKNDLISHLLDAQDNANLITKQECISQLILLLFAGLDTVPQLIGNSIVALHENPEQFTYLKSNPSIFSTALHELLRYAPPVHMVNMEAFENIEIGDCLVEKGNKIVCLLAAGNRDPKIFNNPDSLDLSRKKTHLLSFSEGIHNCLGMHLSLILFEVAMKILMEKIPEMKLVNITEMEWNLSYTFRGLKTLKAVWSLSKEKK